MGTSTGDVIPGIRPLMTNARHESCSVGSEIVSGVAGVAGMTADAGVGDVNFEFVRLLASSAPLAHYRK